MSKLLDRINDEPLYLLDEFEKIVIRTNPKTKQIWAKPQGGTEYKVDWDVQFVNEAFMEGNEITKEQYDSY